MSQELIQQPAQPMTMFHQAPALPANINAGAVTIEIERAVAEAKGQMQLAKLP